MIVLLTGIAVAGDTGTAVDADRSQLEFQLGLVEAAGFAALLALILGITIVTTEFRHGTVTPPTFLAAPRREQVLGSKTIAGSIVAVLFGLLALLVVAAVGLPWLSIVGADIHVSNGEIGVRAAQTLLGAVLWALMGVAVGSSSTVRSRLSSARSSGSSSAKRCSPVSPDCSTWTAQSPTCPSGRWMAPTAQVGRIS